MYVTETTNNWNWTDIRDKAAYNVDKEYIMMVSDWYHEQMAGPRGLINYYLGPGGARGTFVLSTLLY